MQNEFNHFRTTVHVTFSTKDNNKSMNVSLEINSTAFRFYFFAYDGFFCVGGRLIALWGRLSINSVWFSLITAYEYFTGACDRLSQTISSSSSLICIQPSRNVDVWKNGFPNVPLSKWCQISFFKCAYTLERCECSILTVDACGAGDYAERTLWEDWSSHNFHNFFSFGPDSVNLKIRPFHSDPSIRSVDRIRKKSSKTDS